MNRDAFIRLLARAVQDGTITEEQARELLRQFDAGMLPLDTLPLLAGEMDSSPTEELIAASVAALALLLGRRARGQRIVSTGRTTAQAALVFIVDRIQEQFERLVAALAAQLASGEISLTEWQQRMNEATLRNLTEQTLAGSGSDRLDVAQRQRIRQLMREQNAYLSRFADTIAVTIAIGTALSVAAISNRAESYAGIARGEYFRSAEEAADDNPDLVYEYVARDDGSTCGPCHDAQGFYLPGDGPQPGQVCEGRARCRCRREPRVLPDVARRLRGAP